MLAALLVELSVVAHGTAIAAVLVGIDVDIVIVTDNIVAYDRLAADRLNGVVGARAIGVKQPILGGVDLTGDDAVLNVRDGGVQRPLPRTCRRRRTPHAAGIITARPRRSGR